MPIQRRLRYLAIVVLLAAPVGVGATLFLTHWPSGDLARAQEAASEVNRVAQSHTNLLIHESSPYLLQHAHNPVNWHPWGEEAFAKAKRENKPIFLSIGYSTCYWCHVMEVESFEDAEVAAVLNEHFVAIKVDREERPDIDEQYMIALQLLTERGGWPNSVWLTPDGKPWMAGTYFPKARFLAVLSQLDNLWKSRRADIDQQAEAISVAVKQLRGPVLAANPQLSTAMIDKGTQAVLAAFDPEHAGFGGAPKFPPHAALRLLIQRYASTSDEQLLEPITATLDAMWRGGIHDHVGGGFHRYATDADWLVPHFEKMLYDNAQLMRSYADAFHIDSDPNHRDAVADIYQWVQSDMTSPQGGFYSAVDSGEVGREGEAYLWTMEQLHASLSKDDAETFADVYHFEPGGNFRDESTGQRTGANIPHRTESLATTAQRLAKPVDELTKQLASVRGTLLTLRQSRPQPRKDDKILTSWNGLMIGSLAHAGRAVADPRYTRSAQRAAEFILDNMVRDGKLLHTYRDGQAKLPGYLDDYAYFIQGLVELYRATGEDRWLQAAKRFASDMIAGFEDKNGGGFYFTTNDHEQLLVRSKHLGGGGSVPNPNGIAALVLIELSELSGDASYREAARRTLASLAELMSSQPQASKDLLLATSVFLKAGETEQLANEVHRDAGSVTQPGADAAQNPSVRQVGPVSIQVTVSQSPVIVAQPFTITVSMAIDDGWHLYADNPAADFLHPCEVTVSPGDSLSIGRIERPRAKRQLDSTLNQMLATYAGRIEFQIPVTITAKNDSGETTVEVEVTFQACDANRCLPSQTITLQLPLSVNEPTPK